MIEIIKDIILINLLVYIRINTLSLKNRLLVYWVLHSNKILIKSFRFINL